MNRRRQPANPWRLILLVLLVGGALYVNQVVVPATPPLFVPTRTPTRAPESFTVEADSLAAQGKFNQAIQMYKAAIQAAPKNPINYISSARLQIYTGDYDGALENIQNALLINPNNSTAQAIKGWALGFKGDYLPATAALKQAIDLDPNNAVAYAYYAEVLVRQMTDGKGDLGSKDRAIDASRKALALGPNLMESHRARGWVLEYTANYAEAVKEFETAVRMNEHIADMRLALGRNYRFMQQYDKAIEEFNRANALNPQDPMPNILISRTYATVGEFAKAIQYAQQAVKVDPRDPYIQGNLGVLLYRNRAYNDSIPPLRLAVRGGVTEAGVQVKGLPLDYGRVAEFYFTYGLALARTGQCGEALQISQLLIQGVKDDQISVFNAQEIVKICSSAAGGAQPPAATPTSTPKK